MTTYGIDPRARVLGIALALSLGPCVDAGTDKKIRPLDDTTVAVTDFTAAGRELPVPSRQNPVYYVGLSAGFRHFNGFAMAGDNPPDSNILLRTIARVLAQQGFLGATKEHLATQIIVCAWGTIGAPIDTGEAPPTGPGAGIYFLGGRKLRLVEDSPNYDHISVADFFRHRFRSPGAEDIFYLSKQDLYVVRIRAFDLKAAEQGRMVALWETRIACRSAGNSLATALPQIVVSAQHVLGRDTAEPIVENAARTRQAWVEIGESTVVEYIDVKDIPGALGTREQDERPAASAATPPAQ